ncbi:hypothetical protein C7B69_01995 [filamentous cyanobacterium Phorm 46]|nr:hypothetical protein C7B69_01995 [filamentous cyanobacterium Phorm 46]PSB45678.1 hypothetical protein C7B67_21165 [filamentous cyanobacterium Phorm 6]
MAQSIKQLHAQIQVMPSDAVKAIVLSWLNLSNGNLSDFEQSQKLWRKMRDISGEKLIQQTSFNPSAKNKPSQAVSPSWKITRLAR